MERYRIAGLAVDMEVTGRTHQQAAAYVAPAEGTADITVTCDVDQILSLNPDIQDRDLAQYLATGVIFSRKLLAFDGAFLHASAVMLDGKAYLFSAPSGTGKSTHTEKWCRLFGARYINDDKPALRLENGIWMAYGTPWSGKHDLSANVGAPIGGIAILRQAQENSIVPLTPAQALPRMLSQSYYRLSRQEMEKQLYLMDRLLREVPIWELSCCNDDAAAYLSHGAMTGKVDQG